MAWSSMVNKKPASVDVKEKLNRFFLTCHAAHPPPRLPAHLPACLNSGLLAC